MHEHAHFSDDLADMATIYQPGIHLAVTRREPATTVSGFVAAVLTQRLLPAFEGVVRPPASMADILPSALGPMGDALATIPGFQAFCDDVDLQIELFTTLFDLDRVGVRLASLDGPMCPRFHVDYLPCRLISSYGTRGTEWLPERWVDRRLLGRHDLPLKTEADSQIVQAIPPWAIALFRGEDWSGGEVGGVVHRSPHIDSSEPRLLLTLDFVA